MFRFKLEYGSVVQLLPLVTRNLGQLPSVLLEVAFPQAYVSSLVDHVHCPEDKATRHNFLIRRHAIYTPSGRYPSYNELRFLTAAPHFSS